MKALTNKTKVLLVLICVVTIIAGPTAWSADITFNSNVDINSNLVVSGTATVTNNATFISNLTVNGALSATNIMPNSFSASVYISGANSDGVTTNGGDVVVSGGTGGWLLNSGNVFLQGGHGVYDDSAGSVILQGGGSGYGSVGGDVILENNDNGFFATGDIYGGHVKLQTSDGTTRFWLQQDGTLNANSNHIAYALIVPQGDLSMGSFTNSP